MRGEEARLGSTSVLVTGGDEAADAVGHESNVIGVTYERDAESWLAQWSGDADRVVVVSVGEQSRGSAAATASADCVEAASGVVETVPRERAVGEVGALVHEYLSAWEGPTTVRVDDLASVLDAVSTETAFRFVHAVLARTEAGEDTAVVSLDADAYPPHVVDTFAELFDDVR